MLALGQPVGAASGRGLSAADVAKRPKALDLSNPQSVLVRAGDRVRRREVLALVAFSALDWPPAASAEQKRSPVIGWLGIAAASTPGVVRALSAFWEGLGEMGFVEGRNVRLDYRWAEGHIALHMLAAGLVADRVDVIIAAGSLPQALAAKAATQTIPVVFLTGADPVAEGLIASLARPGGNLTGVAVQYIEMSGKWVELLSELVPQAKTIGLLINPNYGAAKRQEEFIVGWRKAARTRGLRLRVVKAGNEGELSREFASLTQLRVDALVVTPYFMISGRPKQVAALAMRFKVPTISSGRVFVAAGGLMSYGPSPLGSWHKVGIYAGRILRGANPADLPVQQPTKFELTINLETAKALNLTVPQSLLALADQVIE